MHNLIPAHINIRLLPFLAMGLLLLGACNTGKDKKADDVDTTRYQLATDAGPGEDPAIQLTPQVVSYQGATYTIAVSRAACDSVPLVKDSYGDPYKDNVVTIAVTRDGEPCLSRRFVKTDFAAAAQDIDLQPLTLGGMAFSRIDAGGYHFGAQLCTPGDVEGGYAFTVTLPLDGGSPTIKRDTNAATMSDEFVD